MIQERYRSPCCDAAVEVDPNVPKWMDERYTCTECDGCAYPFRIEAEEPTPLQLLEARTGLDWEEFDGRRLFHDAGVWRCTVTTQPRSATWMAWFEIPGRPGPAACEWGKTAASAFASAFAEFRRELADHRDRVLKACSQTDHILEHLRHT